MKAFEKIIGYEKEKKELMQIADILKNPEFYKKLGASAPSGLLLDGQPGLGKTLMANCLIKESGRKAFVCRKDKPDGEFVNYIKETFDKACENAPSIVFLDDMDKFANEDESRRNAEEYVTVQSCIDSVKGKDVFVLATTNSRRNLPDSLIRQGRFDKIINIYRPEPEDALLIIKHYLKNKVLVSDIDTEYIAKLMSSFSCAEIESVINKAAMIAGFERCERISQFHFINASLETVFRTHPFEIFEGDIDLEDGDARLSEIVYHEAGHAVVSELLSPESITLIGVEKYSGCVAEQRGHDYLSTSRSSKQILTSLAGMAAVDLKYGKKGRGSNTDIEDAKSEIKMNIDGAQYGFGMIECYERLASENIKSAWDNLVNIELERYYRETKQILAKNREFLDKLANELAEKKLLTMHDIQRIKSQCNIKEVDTKW